MPPGGDAPAAQRVGDRGGHPATLTSSRSRRSGWAAMMAARRLTPSECAVNMAAAAYRAPATASIGAAESVAPAMLETKRS